VPSINKTKNKHKMRALLISLIFVSFYINTLDAQKIKVLKTPNKQFENLFEYPFNENYVVIDNELVMHYLDEGGKNKPVVLLVHGEPNWSYVYRNMIAGLVEKGYRVIVPDLIGFGKSDKPINKKHHTYTNHTKWLKSFIDELNLKNINCYAHDWGAMISLRIIAAEPNLFSKVAISYGFLFTGEEKVPESFYGWQKFSQTDSAFSAGTIMNWGSYTDLSSEVQKAYNAPFPSEKYKAGVRQFPVIVPVKEDDYEAIVNKKLRQKLKLFNKPFLTIWGNTKDEMWLGKDEVLQNEIPGAKNQNHQRLKSNHFIQEDKATEIVEILLKFFSNKN